MSPSPPDRISRRTFVLHVHERDGTAVLEDVRTGERVRVDGLAGIPAHIVRWLGAPTNRIGGPT
jgi:hypothetical protein